ncbi:MAG: hypothetical protein H0X39_13455, partial [Actinobacteria bacterium]|nr:hypothetical protein [Actinomycetota bacterium]
MRRPFVWISFVLSLLVIAGLVVQLYLIAAWIFGSGGALDAHKFVGGAVVHPAEILVFLVALGGWWRTWRNIGVSFALALLGTIQVFFAGDLKDPGNGYVHGLHGGLALFVAALAAY